MQKSSLKRFSLLGLVLLAASAVTAAFTTTSKSDVANEKVNGQLSFSTRGGATCTVNGGGAQCNVTEGTVTTEGGESSGAHTDLNTTTV